MIDALSEEWFCFSWRWHPLSETESNWERTKTTQTWQRVSFGQFWTKTGETFFDFKSNTCLDSFFKTNWTFPLLLRRCSYNCNLAGLGVVNLFRFVADSGKKTRCSARPWQAFFRLVLYLNMHIKLGLPSCSTQALANVSLASKTCKYKRCRLFCLCDSDKESFIRLMPDRWPAVRANSIVSVLNCHKNFCRKPIFFPNWTN
jgi:hypothetical protein